ncbi:hypothetical protein [Blastopirellula marina]|nr:hypothetical protein [Blastopirellula marina]
MIDYKYDEPAFTGTVLAAECDTHRDLLSAIDDFEANGKPYYLILTKPLVEEFEGWVAAFRTMLWQQQLGRFETILSWLNPFSIPTTLAKAKLKIDRLDAKIQERRGFYTCYIANNYKYRDGCIGVNLCKLSRPGSRMVNWGKAPL